MVLTIGGRSVQYDERCSVEDVRPIGINPCRILGMTGVDRHDLAISDEVTGHSNRLIEKAARIVPQVEDKRPKLAMRLLLERLDGIRASA